MKEPVLVTGFFIGGVLQACENRQGSVEQSHAQMLASSMAVAEKDFSPLSCPGYHPPSLACSGQLWRILVWQIRFSCHGMKKFCDLISFREKTVDDREKWDWIINQSLCRLRCYIWFWRVREFVL
jgi:hypothetical protein